MCCTYANFKKIIYEIYSEKEKVIINKVKQYNWFNNIINQSINTPHHAMSKTLNKRKCIICML